MMVHSAAPSPAAVPKIRDPGKAMALSFTGFPSSPSPGLVQRCVIIQKDQHGFGFTVSGDRIVLVQSVRPGERAEGPGDTLGPPHLLHASGEM